MTNKGEQALVTGTSSGIREQFACTELSGGAVITFYYTKAKSSACWKHASSA